MGDFAAADLVLVGLVLLSAVFGGTRGFMKEVLSLGIWTAALLLALAFGRPLGSLILDANDKLQAGVGFALVFLGVLLAGALVQRLVHSLVETTGLTGTDRVLGLVFGAARGGVVVLFALVMLRPFAEDRRWWRESRLVPPIIAYEEDVMALASALADAFSEAKGVLPAELEEAAGQASRLGDAISPPPGLR